MEMDTTDRESRSDEESDWTEEEEEVDPRIQGELEKLNQSTEQINRCETELEEARQRFRSVLVEATLKLDELLKKIGKAVEESKPYWKARHVARQTGVEAQGAVQEFQRATEVLQAAKETIALAEETLLQDRERQLDSAWQEMLNHATYRVMQAEQTKTRSELLHKETAAKYNTAIKHMKQLGKKLKRTISKSKPYFELKAKYYVQLEQQKQNVDELQAKLTQAKAEYKTALKNLETISDEIHERRRSSVIGPRERGVGSEVDEVTVDDLTGYKLESDGISMASEVFEDEDLSGSGVSEDSESLSTCSRSSEAPEGPLDLPCCSASSSCASSPSLSPPSLRSRLRPLPLCSSASTPSLSDLALVSPILGARSDCSGASSPECYLHRGERADGAEAELSNALNNSSSISSMRSGLCLLSLNRGAVDNARDARHFPFSVA